MVDLSIATVKHLAEIETFSLLYNEKDGLSGYNFYCEPEIETGVFVDSEYFSHFCVYASSSDLNCTVSRRYSAMLPIRQVGEIDNIKIKFLGIRC